MISMIVCYDARRHIGKNDELLVKIPEDLKRFKQRTLGCNIIMGRKTLRVFLDYCHIERTGL